MRGKVSRRTTVISGGLSLAGVLAPLGRAAALGFDEKLSPEMFGARGDGVTNDTAAFAALAAEITRRGGGTIAMRRTVYIVGAQRHNPADGGYAFSPAKLLSFVGLQGPLTILGNGAIMRCASGLRFGAFAPVSGMPSRHPRPSRDPRERATPYEYMIHVQECAGSVMISDLELDGNIPKLVLGGEFGDTGRQIAGSGIFLRNNRGDEILQRIHTHHHPQDGFMIDGIDDPNLAKRVTRRAEDIRSEYNARQGCSIIGVHDWSFSKCKFNHTGRAAFNSAPGAGLDIEAEGGKRNRNLSFQDCEFSDNTGCGLVADSGDSEGVSFTRCRFIGTSNWSVWPKKPSFRFANCTFVGSVVHCLGDRDPRRATKFVECLFTDDPKLSPTGKVYREGRADGSLADLGGSDTSNVLFDRCRFLAVGGAVLPWTIGVTYANCTMRQTSRSLGYPRGIFVGRNSIDGNVSLYGIKIQGELILNGKPFRP